ncbi:hypothetical protein B0T26DRAFT_797683 [Lasiosphaeria miniovina]|uniref:Uncharacterized protein n=1 Tax=Lasiosphaeria miniovina TaxID=1954250 RepID=A0AA40BG89_9PEZI|nr:uncharacterized protein B0T26DRAFT_797683 [Lasiosphaeria miniovina]KAK0733682.1 hypothetical protein B0T26DRAFT_797683 [Lasiosphaeria miniovina]
MGALPEPNVIAGALDTLRVQSHRIANDLGQQMNALGHQVNALGQQTNLRIDAMQQQMDALGQQVNQRFDTLENRQNNFEIAGVNARLVHADGVAILQRPVDVPNSPPTQPQLYEIDDATADVIMPALGIYLAPNTPLAVKRESIARK